MRHAATIVVLLVLAFVAGSAAAAIGYGDEDACLTPADFVEGSSAPAAAPDFRWWPLGNECVRPGGEVLPDDERPSVLGSLAACGWALVALAVAWRWRERGWARGLAVGVAMLALMGYMTGYGGVQVAWFTATWLGPVLGAAVDLALTPRRERSLGRSALAGLAGLGVLFVAVFFVMLGSSVAALLLALPAAALAGWLPEWVLRTPVVGRPT